MRKNKSLGVRFCVLCAVIAILTLAPIATSAQTLISGDLSGTVTDPSGAAVVGCNVTLKSSGSGEILKATTGTTGGFRFSFLRPGSYTVTIAESGYQIATRQVEVAVGQSTTSNIKLALAGTVIEVEVAAEAATLQTENGNISTTFTQAMIENAPNPGNDMTYIAQTSPGTVMNTQAGYGNFSTNGMSATSNLFTVNGMNDNDPFLNLNNSGATNLMLGANDIGEATVINNGYSGEYGGLAGANVNYVTKSGTNAWHGNLQYFYNDDTLNANSWMNDHAGNPKSFALAQQYAGSVGGPIKKNKAFIFFNAEGLYVALPTVTPTLVPTAAIQSAILANLATVQPSEVGFYKQIFGLYNNAPGVSRAVPAPNSCPTSGASSNPVTAFLAASNGVCANLYTASIVNHTHENMQMGRFDYNIGNNDRTFLHIRRDVGVQATYTDPLTPLFNMGSNQPEYDGQFAETHTFGTKAVNQFIASAMYYGAIFNVPNVSDAVSALPLTVSFSGAYFYNVGPYSLFNAGGRNVTQYQFIDDYSRSWGKHDLKFGINFVRDDVSDFDILGNVLSGTAANETLDDFFAGAASQYSQQFPSGGKLSVPIATYGLGFYAQDEWRARPNLKLTLALRAEHNSNPVCQINCFARFGTAIDALNPNSPDVDTILDNQHQAMTKVDAINWEPRFGFAYTPFGPSGLVVRGGFGIFVDKFPATIADYMLSNAPFNNGFTLYSVPSLQGASAAAAASNAGFVAGYAGGASVANTPGFPTPSLLSPAPSVHSPQYQEWNIQIEKNIDKVGILSINYVGNHGIHEPFANGALNAYDTNGFGGLPLSVPNPNFGVLQQVNSAAVSNYNGVTLGFTRRYRSLQLQANYTWSHALDEVSNGGILPFSYNDNISVLAPQNPFNLKQFNYGNADYDVRQSASINGVWNTPKFANKYVNALAQWTVGGTFFAHNGYPYTVIDGGLTSTLAGENYGSIPSQPLLAPSVFANKLVGGIVSCGGSAATTPCAAMLNDFASVSPTGVTGVGSNTWGNQRRNQLVGPAFFDTNLTLMKNFTIPRSECKLALGAQFFNLFNHPNFDQPIANIANSAQFGQIYHTLSAPTSMYGSFLGADASPRQIQLRATLNF
jgi:hypothetical protein